MFPLVMYGITEASTTRNPSSPCTRSEAGSVTASAPVPILAVQDGCSAVSASRRTQSRICSPVATSGPGDSSPALYSSNAGWFRMSRVTRMASAHSWRSVGVDR